MRANTLLAAAMCFCLVLQTCGYHWKCYDGWNVAGWDTYHLRPLGQRFDVVTNLNECKDKCGVPNYLEVSPDNPCTFVVFDRSTGKCWQKNSWMKGPDGRTERVPGVISCLAVSDL